MDCKYCDLPQVNYGYSNRRAKTFEVEMKNDLNWDWRFQDGVAVPCFFRENLKGSCGNWQDAKCQSGYVFYMYLEQGGWKIRLTGTYWRSVIRVYNIQLGDVLAFTYVGGDEGFDEDSDAKFHLTVYQVGENGRREQENPVALHLVIEMMPEVRAAIDKMVFTSSRDIREEAMETINVAVLGCLVEEIDDPSFNLMDMRFWVDRVTADDIDLDFNELIVPAKTVEGYKCPKIGDALYWRDGMEEPIVGSYEFGANGKFIMFTIGWAEFMAASNIGQYDIVVVKVEARENAIGLEFVEY